MMMLSPSLRRLPYNLIYSATFMFTVILFLLLLPAQRIFIENGVHDGFANDNDGRAKSFMVAATEDDAEAKLKAIFISDIKKLLTHNQVFYNSYGRKDNEVDLAFEEARIAADVIYLYPEIFRVKIVNINYRINDALMKAQEMDQKGEMTADGVQVFFVDKYLLILGMIGGVVRFPE